MARRDNTVPRSSLIAALAFLFLSMVLNFLLWRWGDTQNQVAIGAQQRLTMTQDELRKHADKAQKMQVMLGLGSFTQAEFDLMSQSSSGDPEMDAITRSFVRDMALFGQEVEAQNRNYPALPVFLINSIRARNAQYAAAREEADKARAKAKSDVPRGNPDPRSEPGK